MSTFLIKPNFNRLRNMLTIPADKLNMFLRTEIQDTLGFYQRQFGIFSYMKMTSTQKFVIHTLGGSPMMWQPHKSCAWEPTGSITTSNQELSPCKAKINEQTCYDELFSSCFEHLLQWNGNGPLNMGPVGMQVMNDLVRTVAENAALGARLTLTAGQMFDPATVNFNNKVSYELKTLFTKTVGTCKGWVELLRDMGASSAAHAHLDVQGVFNTSDFSGKKFIGNPLAVFDSLRDAAPMELTAVINEGGIAGSLDTDFRPLFLVSTSLYNAITEEYRKLCISVTCINPRLTRQEVSVSTSRGARTQYVYYIDDIPVIPISDISYYDRFLVGATHFAAITVSGNIGLGSSFDSIPDPSNGGNAGVMVQLSQEAKDYGTYYFLSHSLFSTVIADTDYIVATQKYAEAA